MKEGIFGSVPIQQWKSSKFDLSHDVKLTGNMGDIIPILCEEVLPGDHWRWRGNLLIRFAPLLAPVMHRVKATMHAFHVANRTLTTSWKDAITGGEDGESTDVIPYISIKDMLNNLAATGQEQFEAKVGPGSLWDNLGLPTIDWVSTTPGYVALQNINILPFLAYTQIWQYFYKDQNVDTNDLMEEPIAGGNMNVVTFITNYMTLKKRAWQKDPFTSALPWPQRGPEVLLPVQGTATGEDIVYKTVSDLIDSGTNGPVAAGAAAGSPGAVGTNLQAGIPAVSGGNAPIVIASDARIENVESITFQNNTITINDLRTAVVVQQWQELTARGGSRYNEFVKQHYGTTVPDYRIDQPEYIGGGTQFVKFSEVLTTANSLDSEDNNVPPATMTGHGISAGSSNTFDYAVKEHGWIIVLLSVLPETNYQQGLPKKFTRIDRLDYAYPVFAGLGEQEILTQEVMFDPFLEDQEAAVFGYQQRYWEYKHLLNRTCGDFRTTLDFWTMTRIFEAPPEQIDTAFVYADPTTRIFAVEDDSHKLWMQVIHEISALRKLPYFSVPGVLKI